MQVQRKILVIDDEPVTRGLLKNVLVNAGYEVFLAEDGLSGVELARSEKPDLVITDGLLPKMHGFLVCKAIKEFDSPPKVIILTGLYTKPTYKWSVKRDYGADDLQIKPITPADLLACVKNQLGELPRLDLPEPSPVALPTENENHWQLVEKKGDLQPSFESGDIRFNASEMEEIFNGWAIPTS